MARRDANTAWYAAADSTAEERRLMCPGAPRPDVVAVLTDTGKLVESVKYGSYGVAFGVPVGDTDSDGDWDATDSAAITGTYEVWKDANLDGVVSAADVTHANSITGSYQSLGRTVLSSTAVNNRKGYAGYELDGALAGNKMHVRNRVLDPELGRWLRRDPLGYKNGMSQYEYAVTSPMMHIDPTGLEVSYWCSPCVEYTAGAGTWSGPFGPIAQPVIINTCNNTPSGIANCQAGFDDITASLDYQCENNYKVPCSGQGRPPGGVMGCACKIPAAAPSIPVACTFPFTNNFVWGTPGHYPSNECCRFGSLQGFPVTYIANGTTRNGDCWKDRIPDPVGPIAGVVAISEH